LNATLKKIGLLAAKIGVSVALLGYLIYNAANTPGFKEHIQGQKDWVRLTLALLLVLVAVLLTVFRWQLLARTLGLEFSTKEALRVGFLGYAVNLLPLGLVGGDTVKAVFLARLHPTRKTEAVATVFVDRGIGLVALLLLAAVGTLLVDADGLEIADSSRDQLLLLCRGIQVAAVISVLGALLLFVPGFTTSPLWNQVARIPVVGGMIHKLMTAMHVYRGRANRLLLAMVMSLFVHLLYVVMIYLVGAALLNEAGEPTAQPLLQDHFVFVPMAMAAGTLPQGFFEWLLTLFYEAFVPGDTGNKGLLIALVYRVIQVLVAAIGMAPFILAGKANPVIHGRELLDQDLLPRTDSAAP
jgi:glycosyltransferase 2 family protein